MIHASFYHITSFLYTFHYNLFTVWSNYVSLVVLLIFQCFFILSNTMFIYLIYISICLFSHAFFYYFYYFLFLLLLFFHYIFSFIYHKNTRGGEKTIAFVVADSCPILCSGKFVYLQVDWVS